MNLLRDIYIFFGKSLVLLSISTFLGIIIGKLLSQWAFKKTIEGLLEQIKQEKDLLLAIQKGAEECLQSNKDFIKLALQKLKSQGDL